jgi:hypothetical protein
MSSPSLPADVWYAKLRRAFESIEGLELGAGDKDARMAALVVKLAHLHALVAQLSEEGDDAFRITVRIDSPDCFACGARIGARGKPFLFCSDECKAVSKAVRYVRKKIDDEVDWTPDLLHACGQKILPWATSGRAYDERGRYLAPRRRADIFARDGGRCVLCDAPATQIDHIHGSSPDPSNLRAVCAECNRKLMLDNLVPVKDERQRQEIRSRMTDLAHLIASPVPFALGFDHTRWDKSWRLYAKIRAELAS